MIGRTFLLAFILVCAAAAITSECSRRPRANETRENGGMVLRPVEAAQSNEPTGMAESYARRFRVVEFDGHRWVAFGITAAHHPDCPCHKKEQP